MIGLIVILVIALYVALLVTSSIVGYRVAAKRTASGGKRWLAAALGFAVFFVPVFWDAIPTIWLHRHYCETEGGFAVYKTLDQWKLENPEVAEKQSKSLAPKYSTESPDRVWLTQRFYVERSQDPNFDHAIGREEQILADKVTGEVLARSINFWRGPSWNLISSGGSLNEFRQLFVLSWGNRLCGQEGASPMDEMRDLKTRVANLGSEQ